MGFEWQGFEKWADLKKKNLQLVIRKKSKISSKNMWMTVNGVYMVFNTG